MTFQKQYLIAFFYFTWLPGIVGFNLTKSMSMAAMWCSIVALQLLHQFLSRDLFIIVNMHFVFPATK